MSVRKCPNCGNEIGDKDVDFCTECGYSLSRNVVLKDKNSNGFFDDVIDKTSFSIIIFAFVVFGIFLFIGSYVWGSFMASKPLCKERSCFSVRSTSKIREGSSFRILKVSFPKKS